MADELAPAPSSSRPSLNLPDIPVPGTKAKIPGWSLLVGAGAVVAWLLLGRKSTTSTTAPAAAGPDTSSGDIGNVTPPPPVAPIKPGKPPKRAGSGFAPGSLEDLQAHLAARQKTQASLQSNVARFQAILAGQQQGTPGVDYEDKLGKAQHNLDNVQTDIVKLQEQIAALAGQGPPNTGGSRRNFGLGLYPERGG